MPARVPNDRERLAEAHRGRSPDRAPARKSPWCWRRHGGLTSDLDGAHCLLCDRIPGFRKISTTPVVAREYRFPFHRSTSANGGRCHMSPPRPAFRLYLPLRIDSEWAISLRSRSELVGKLASRCARFRFRGAPVALRSDTRQSRVSRGISRCASYSCARQGRSVARIVGELLLRSGHRLSPPWRSSHPPRAP